MNKYISYLDTFGRSAGQKIRNVRSSIWQYKWDRRFKNRFFNSRKEYDSYAVEFEQKSVSDIIEQSSDEFATLTSSGKWGGIGTKIGKRYYTLVRKLKPDVIVETGVCNGVSTLCTLLALDENDHGTLYSIDYPYYADVPLSEFRDETFEDFGGAAIPSDKEPGWIVPDEYQSQWDLRIGKSQRELPQLVTELESIDVFIHDSEHSLPCMLFEYDLAWEWFGSNGIILSDDIDWNGAFDSFASARTAESGQITSSVGYLIKGGVK